MLVKIQLIIIIIQFKKNEQKDQPKEITKDQPKFQNLENFKLKKTKFITETASHGQMLRKFMILNLNKTKDKIQTNY